MTAPVRPTADAVASAPDAPARGTVPGPDSLAFLDQRHAVHAANLDAWRRDERRLEGGDAVLDELARLEDESDASYTTRKGDAAYRNFARSHAVAVTGTLSSHRPQPRAGFSMGTLGDVRERAKIDTPTLAEAVYYNVDGIGADGTELPAFFDDVDVRAQATGHRWLLCEMPSLAEIRAGRRASGERGVPSDLVSATLADELAGFRPYLVEFSPIDVTNWYVKTGQLQFAVIRVATADPTLEAGELTDPEKDKGFYLLVRAGFRGLGDAFAGGGWWVFDKDKAFLRSGSWSRTRGAIPLWPHYGEPARGTAERPAMSRSSTAMLGQIGVRLMNVNSARVFDYTDACASKMFFLGADGTLMTTIAGQKKNVWIGVPNMSVPDGEGGTKEQPIALYDGSMGAVAADVSQGIVDAIFAEARDESFQQLTSTVDSTGESKRAGFAENKAPFLARRAKLRQQSEQTFVWFAELRSGRVADGASPEGYSVWPVEFDLAPVVEAVDANLDRMRRAGLRSPTLEVGLVKTGLMEDGLWPEEPAEQDAAERELEQSAQQASSAAREGRDQAARDAALLNGEDPSAGDAGPTDTVPPPTTAPRRRRLSIRDAEGNLTRTIDEET